MTQVHPGDRILFRDGDRFGVARVDLVKDRHVTAFPFDMAQRRWSRRNRRIASSFIVSVLPRDGRSEQIALRINRLTNEREALRQQANRWLENSVRELVGEAR